MLALLASLADKHLIYRIGDVGDEPRFGMLETIREFGLEQLAVNEEEAATRAAHAAYYLAMAEANDVPIYNLGRPEALARIEAEHANLRQTLAWLLDNGHGAAARRLTGALFWFWFYRSHLTEGRRWLARALSLPADADEPPAVRARALAGAGALALFQQDLQHAVAPLAEAHRLARDGDDPRALAMVEVLTALLALFQNKLDDVALHAETAANLATPIGDLGSVLRAKFFAALAAHDGGDLQRAAALYEDLLDHTRRAGAMYFQALALQWSARLAQLQAETGLAATRYAEALGIFRDAGELLSVAGCLDGIAAAGSARDGVNAARLIGAGAALRTSIGSPMFPQDRPVHELAISSVTSALGETAFAEAWAAGSQLSLPEALDMAAIVTAAVANGEDSPKSDTVIPGGLTRRELDVLRLLAAGRSDKEIGEALFISHRTAMWHVSNILSKLGASTRAAATSYAVHQGLV